MKYLSQAFFIFFIAGCASDPAHRAEVANQEVARMTPPNKSLSEFRDYNLKPLAVSRGVSADDYKMKMSKELGEKLNTRLKPLISNWQTRSAWNAQESSLIIEPTVQELRVISHGARFWLGILMGESFIDMDLKLTDSTSGQVIANPRIYKTSSSWGGAWSIGATDENLLDYIVDIAHRYLEANYSSRNLNSR